MTGHASRLPLSLIQLETLPVSPPYTPDHARQSDNSHGSLCKTRTRAHFCQQGKATRDLDNTALHSPSILADSLSIRTGRSQCILVSRLLQDL